MFKQILIITGLLSLVAIGCSNNSSSGNSSGNSSDSSTDSSTPSITFKLSGSVATLLENKTSSSNNNRTSLESDNSEYVNLLEMNEDGTIVQDSISNYTLIFDKTYINKSGTKKYLTIDYDDPLNSEINKPLLGCNIIEVDLSNNEWRCFDNSNNIYFESIIAFDENDIAYYLGYKIGECGEWLCNTSGNRRLIKNSNGTSEYLTGESGVARDFHVTTGGDVFVSYDANLDSYYEGIYVNNNKQITTNIDNLFGDDYKTVLFTDDSMAYDYMFNVAMISITNGNLGNRTSIPISIQRLFPSDNGTIYGVSYSKSYPSQGFGEGYVTIYSMFPTITDSVFQIQKNDLKNSNCPLEFPESCWYNWAEKASFQASSNKIYYIDDNSTNYDQIIEHNLTDNSSTNIISGQNFILPDRKGLKIINGDLYFSGLDTSNNKSFLGTIDLSKLNNNQSDYLSINYSESSNEIKEFGFNEEDVCNNSSNPTYSLTSNRYGFSIYFDQCMNLESVENNIAVTSNSNSMPGIKLWFGNTFHYFFNNNLGTDNYTTAYLDNNTTYTLTLPTSIKDKSGNAITSHTENITVSY